VVVGFGKFGLGNTSWRARLS
jgi:hypothetical protein